VQFHLNSFVLFGICPACLALICSTPTCQFGSRNNNCCRSTRAAECAKAHVVPGVFVLIRLNLYLRVRVPLHSSRYAESMYVRRPAPSLSRGAEPANPSPAIMCAFLHITADRRLSTRPNLCAACTQWLVGTEITPARPSVSPKNVQISHTRKMYGHAVHISFAMASVDNALILREYRARRFSKPWAFRDISPNASDITEVK
jgi:hypothetical protein